MCAHTLWNEPDGLRCYLDPCNGTHAYRATAGADLDNGSPGTPKRHADCEEAG